MGFEQINVQLCDTWGGDRNAANAAWASTTNLEKTFERSDDDVRRVVTGLVHLHHDTPKERCWMEFFITCPIYIERQLDKYRLTLQYQDYKIECEVGAFGRWGVTQNELSGRYRTIPDRPYGMPKDVADILHRAAWGDEEPSGARAWKEAVSIVWLEALEEQHEDYQLQLEALKKAEKEGRITNTEYKRAREVLRGRLGTAFLTDMRIVLNMNALEHIINQRLAKDAQLESRIVAAKMLDEVVKAAQVPTMIFEMIFANGWDKLVEDLDG